MDKNLLIIVLSVLAGVNFIIVIVYVTLYRRSKKSSKVKKEVDKVQYYDEEPEGKTEILGRNSVKGRVSSKENSNLRYESIPSLPEEVEKQISEETVIQDSSEPNIIGETVFLNAEEKKKIFTKLSYSIEGVEYSFEMTKQEIFIGRDPAQCDLVISSDKHLGRKHARFFIKDNGFFIEDLKSRNGTFIEGKRIEGVAKVENGKFKLAFSEIRLDEVR